MNYETLEKTGFRKFYPKSVPTVTFAGDRRLCFNGAAVRLMGLDTDAVEVFINSSLGLVALLPTTKNSVYSLTLAARGKEPWDGHPYAKRISFGGVLEFLPNFPWEFLNGKSCGLTKTLIGKRIVYVVNLTNLREKEKE